MPKYDGQYDPPAPTALISLCDSSGTLVVDGIRMLIDSGADATLLPQSAIEKSRLTFVPGEEMELSGYDGMPNYFPVVYVDLIFLRRRYRGQYPVVPGDEGVLGRDILNQIVLVLDGPGTEWTDR